MFVHGVSFHASLILLRKIRNSLRESDSVSIFWRLILKHEQERVCCVESHWKPVPYTCILSSTLVSILLQRLI